jgi:hypothetical protein
MTRLAARSSAAGPEWVTRVAPANAPLTRSRNEKNILSSAHRPAGIRHRLRPDARATESDFATTCLDRTAIACPGHTDDDATNHSSLQTQVRLFHDGKPVFNGQVQPFDAQLQNVEGDKPKRKSALQRSGAILRSSLEGVMRGL